MAQDKRRPGVESRLRDEPLVFALLFGFTMVEFLDDLWHRFRPGKSGQTPRCGLPAQVSSSGYRALRVS